MNKIHSKPFGLILFTGCFGLKVVGFLDSFSKVEPKVIGFFVGFGFSLAGVVLSHGDLVLVIKFGSVVTCHGVEDHESAGRRNKIRNLNGKIFFLKLTSRDTCQSTQFIRRVVKVI